MFTGFCNHHHNQSFENTFVPPHTHQESIPTHNPFSPLTSPWEISSTKPQRLICLSKWTLLLFNQWGLLPGFAIQSFSDWYASWVQIILPLTFLPQQQSEFFGLVSTFLIIFMALLGTIPNDLIIFFKMRRLAQHIPFLMQKFCNVARGKDNVFYLASKTLFPRYVDCLMMPTLKVKNSF